MIKIKDVKDVYDIIIPIGISCRVATNLKAHNLRVAATPLDWMMDYTLDTAANLQEVSELRKRKPKTTKTSDDSELSLSIKQNKMAIYNFTQNTF